MKFFVTLAVLAALGSGQVASAQVSTGNTQTEAQTRRNQLGAQGSVERQAMQQQARELFTSIRNWSTTNSNALNDSQIRRLAANMLTNADLKKAAEDRMKDTNAANQELNKLALQSMSYVGRGVVAESGSKAEAFSNFAINAIGTDAVAMTPAQRESALESAKKGIAVLSANAGNFEAAMDAIATEVATRRQTKPEDMAKVKQEIIENIRNLCKKA